MPRKAFHLSQEEKQRKTHQIARIKKLYSSAKNFAYSEYGLEGQKAINFISYYRRKEVPYNTEFDIKLDAKEEALKLVKINVETKKIELQKTKELMKQEKRFNMQNKMVATFFRVVKNRLSKCLSFNLIDQEKQDKIKKIAEIIN